MCQLLKELLDKKVELFSLFVQFIKWYISCTFDLSIHTAKIYSSILSQSKVKSNFIFTLVSVLELARLLALLLITGFAFLQRQLC